MYVLGAAISRGPLPNQCGWAAGIGVLCIDSIEHELITQICLRPHLVFALIHTKDLESDREFLIDGSVW